MWRRVGDPRALGAEEELMTMPIRSWLLAACAVAVGCSEPSKQVLTGRVDSTQGAVAVRAVADDAMVTAAEVKSDGTFTIALPANNHYRLELLTRTGEIKHLTASTNGGLRDIAFKVCKPIDPYNIGGVGAPGMHGTCDPNDPTCNCDSTNSMCGPPKCDPGDPNCGGCDPNNGTTCPPPPPCGGPNEPPCKCDPTMDPNCIPPPPPCTDPNDPNCNGGGTTCTDPTDPNCMCGGANEPPCKCDPATDPNCVPPPPPGCTDPNDPNCCDPSNGTMCPPPKCDPAMDPNCGSTCTSMNDPGCGPPCPDPMDPNSCKDQCMDDPSMCGCKEGDPNCWPAPKDCDPTANGCCKPGDAVTPEHPPGDFGCPG
jgi:hypothetical protein